MNKSELKALKTVLEYLSDEKEHFELSGHPKRHIYRDIEVLEKYLQANTGLQLDKACRHHNLEIALGGGFRCSGCGTYIPRLATKA